MAKARQPTSDAVEIIHRRFFENRPERMELLEKARLNAQIAQQVYDLRTGAKLTQRQLAKRVGTTASVICRLEDADYEGHSLSMLQRIAAAVGNRLEVRFIEDAARSTKARAQRRRAASKVKAAK